MKLEKIITMANKAVEIEFRAMERSLRATGCNLPIWVIPYNDDLFELPQGSEWWLMKEVNDWLISQKAMAKLRKYQCFLTTNYQFVDSDICFLRNPAEVLNPYEGFITSCLHWSNPEGTYTNDSLKYMRERTTLWPSQVFNSGQFACDKQLYDLDTLIQTASNEAFRYTCIDLWRDQPGINMMVFASGVNIINLTLPPIYMQSTWAGDYNSGMQNYWVEEARKPYLIHWAGLKPSLKQQRKREIDAVFFSFITEEEKKEWKLIEEKRDKEYNRKKRTVRFYGRKLKRALHVLMNEG